MGEANSEKGATLILSCLSPKTWTWSSVVYMVATGCLAHELVIRNPNPNADRDPDPPLISYTKRVHFVGVKTDALGKIETQVHARTYWHR